MEKKPPNIILIITDQQRPDTIRGLNAPYMITPTLDRLVKEGVSFCNTHVTAPSCVPSRASLFTGYYAHNTGVLTNGDRWSPTWVSMLAEKGYQCVNIGKMHTIPINQPAGFHERFVVENKDRNRHLENHTLAFYDEWDRYLAHKGVEKPGREYYMRLPGFEKMLGAVDWPLAEEDHPDVFVGNTVLWWLKQRQSNAPLFLQIGFPGPHPPYDPVTRYVDQYLGKELPIPNTTEAELKLQPPPHKEYRDEMIHFRGSQARGPHDSAQWVERPTQEQLHRLRAYYYANVTMIDQKIGAIIDLLETQGYIDNTVVIFTSDHGDALGDHNHIQKFMMYDSMVRVPLIFWAPNILEGGKQTEALVQLMDIAPTILDVAEVDTPNGWDSRSLTPLLKGEESTFREYVFAEHPPIAHHPMMAGPGTYWKKGEKRYDGSGLVTMVRSETIKVVHYLGQPYGELYDLSNDKGEKINLWNDPAYDDIKRKHLDVIRDWSIRSNYTSSSSVL